MLCFTVSLVQAGDKTPGRVFELVAESLPVGLKRPSSTSGVGSKGSGGATSRRILTGWKLGKQMAGGDKIILREARKKYTAPPAPAVSSPSLTERKRNLSVDEDIHMHHHDEDHAMPPSSSGINGSLGLGGGGTGACSSSDARPYAKHSRSINSESVELLTLHSDMRCFVMDETPIAAFCDALLQSQSAARSGEEQDLAKGEPGGAEDEEEAAPSNVYIPHQAGRRNIEHGMSYLRQQFNYMHKKSVWYCMFWVVVVSIVCALRVALVRHAEVNDAVSSGSSLGWVGVYIVVTSVFNSGCICLFLMLTCVPHCVDIYISIHQRCHGVFACLIAHGAHRDGSINHGQRFGHIRSTDSLRLGRRGQ